MSLTAYMSAHVPSQFACPARSGHLGSFYNDSEAYGGITSSPMTHGFDFFNATVGVAPTTTTNCECSEEWYKHCDFGQYGVATHCEGKGNPGGGPPLSAGCCFNYCKSCLFRSF